MHIHVLGICGTFMAGLALLARELGHRVSGCDANVYPPMSTQLAAAGIDVLPGYAAEHLQLAPDVVIVGNAMTRGSRYPIVEALLNSSIPYTSGPQWLAEYVLRDRWVLAVAGTHGKTTTSSLLAFILEQAGLQPGFLIGGVPVDFGVSARLGGGAFFVIEADEYDTAFFDKRSKFVHYRPRTLILNNLEFDHGDIFPDIAAIQRQFHHLLRTVPGVGLVVSNGADERLEQVLNMGCWTPVERFGHGPWQVREAAADGSSGTIYFAEQCLGQLRWSQLGQHNLANALAAIAAARSVGVAPAMAISALAGFNGVRRRLELRGTVNGVAVYDDFAHHPTAIATTLAGLRARTDGRLIAVLEPRSNTMRSGVFDAELPAALATADSIVMYQAPDLGHNLTAALAPLGDKVTVCTDLATVVATACAAATADAAIVVMSNGGFGGIHERLLTALAVPQTVAAS